jgi:signal transduction histidine kinase
MPSIENCTSQFVKTVAQSLIAELVIFFLACWHIRNFGNAVYSERPFAAYTTTLLRSHEENRVVMISPDSRLFCKLENMPGSEREQQRLKTLAELGLLDAESIPVFDEATQTAARWVNVPICLLSIMQQEHQLLKSAVGLSRMGLMNEIASSRRLLRRDSWCTHVVDSEQRLSISDAATHPAFIDSLLVQRYGLRAYLGVPLITSKGHCLGTLAVMDSQPRIFSEQDAEFLELIARWCMSEFERNYLLKAQPHRSQRSPIPLPTEALPGSTSAQTAPSPESEPSRAVVVANSMKTRLIAQMAQELRTPLTSILGMTSVLTRQIYGPLTDKQKEYMGIVHNSGQYLLSLVNEILELGALEENGDALNLSPVDIEMLCQQAMSTLESVAERREQSLRLTIEPGCRVWLLDKDKVRQIVYHFIFSLIQASTAESIIRIHVSRRQQQLCFTLWTSHPWLGDGIPHTELFSNPLVHSGYLISETAPSVRMPIPLAGQESSASVVPLPALRSPALKSSRQSLGLMLSHQLAEIHKGSISIQGTPEAGFRYVILLPQLATDEPVH